MGNDCCTFADQSDSNISGRSWDPEAAAKYEEDTCKGRPERDSSFGPFVMLRHSDPQYIKLMLEDNYNIECLEEIMKRLRFLKNNFIHKFEEEVNMRIQTYQSNSVYVEALLEHVDAYNAYSKRLCANIQENLDASSCKKDLLRRKCNNYCKEHKQAMIFYDHFKEKMTPECYGEHAELSEGTSVAYLSPARRDSSDDCKDEIHEKFENSVGDATDATELSLSNQIDFAALDELQKMMDRKLMSLQQEVADAHGKSIFIGRQLRLLDSESRELSNEWDKKNVHEAYALPDPIIERKCKLEEKYWYLKMLRSDNDEVRELQISLADVEEFHRSIDIVLGRLGIEVPDVKLQTQCRALHTEWIDMDGDKHDVYTGPDHIIIKKLELEAGYMLLKRMKELSRRNPDAEWTSEMTGEIDAAKTKEGDSQEAPEAIAISRGTPGKGVEDKVMGVTNLRRRLVSSCSMHA